MFSSGGLCLESALVLNSAGRLASRARARAQVRGIACQRPNSLVYVAGSPTHEQHDNEGEPWVKMDAGFSVRHLIKPMRAMAEQCAVPPENLVRSLDRAAVASA